ncbi:transglutaminase-like cysteine peptidase [Devosia sp.]|uniref:transglutaminase-like cysteine peptidase n=1 Tax=Devosia sp. TaxID=1871048 RepID=UPI001AD570A5|nr:transglutaminase-like cysteine peptidase [Devosia sp.]MBN9334451.1 transglutaminase-like cysteine peptidase [Devosia sp.]
MANRYAVFASVLLCCAAAFGFAMPVSAQSIDFTNAAFVPVSSRGTSIPIGAYDFCSRLPGECKPFAKVKQAEILTQEKWTELLWVNASVNARIIPMSDMDLYGVEEFWTYPNDGYGDCDDIALEKRRELIQLGWAPSTLLMTVVRQANGEGHAVLMVRTDRGDLILDNLEGEIRVWNQTPYRFLKRQSQASLAKWVDIWDDRNVVITASTAQ